ncbi:hypothetical protein EIP86_003865 [Pleurotus ostreatoroseus]|nr:hypothetical protein EIP86_003865 [Pleurotus ostreatoroseus]
MAARCTENRRARFLQAVESKSSSSASSPGFANESKVDHLTIILELYTRSYELFKKYSPPSSQTQGRQTLWIAYRIAQTYYESGKFDMAVRFFERIAKTYRREKWDAMLVPLLSTWYACAQQLGDMELGVQLLIEMITYGASVERDDPETAQEDLMAVLRSTVPSYQDKPLVVDVSDSEPLLDTSLVFWSPEVKVDERAVFQLALSAPSDVHMSSLPFTSFAIYFSDDSPPMTVVHKATEDDTPTIQMVDLGHIEYPIGEHGDESKEIEANLRWQAGGTIVFRGTVASRSPTVISISKVVLTLKEGSWWIEIPLTPTATRSGSTQPPRWLKSVSPPRFVTLRPDGSTSLSSVTVRHRPHNVQVSLSHQAPAYVGEEYPIVIEVINADDRTLEITTDVLLQPSEIEAAVHSISYDKESWTNLIKGVSFGVLAPGVSVLKTLYLNSSGAAGDRVIDISIQSRNTADAPAPAISPLSPKSPAVQAADTGETLRTVVVPTVSPIEAETSVMYSRSRNAQPPLADLETYDHEFWEDGVGGEATVVTSWRCVGPHGLHIESVKMIKDDGPHARVVDFVVETNLEDLLTDWFPGDEFCDQCQLSFNVDEESEDPISGPGLYEISWRRILDNGGYGSLGTSIFRLPSLQPPRDGLIALLDVPTTANLHVPVPMRLVIRNQRLSRSANVVVQLEFDAADGFVLAGLRSGRIPILLPGGEEVLTWNIIPVECGLVRVPHIKVTDRRAPVGSHGGTPLEGQTELEGEDVEVVDIRRDARSVESAADAAKSAKERRALPWDIRVLVLP